MTDKFFSQPNCDRCHSSLEGKSRKMSWFTEDCLCEECSKKESILRERLDKEGQSSYNLEGCGYMPTLKGEK